LGVGLLVLLRTFGRRSGQRRRLVPRPQADIANIAPDASVRVGVGNLVALLVGFDVAAPDFYPFHEFSTQIIGRPSGVGVAAFRWMVVGFGHAPRLAGLQMQGKKIVLRRGGCVVLFRVLLIVFVPAADALRLVVCRRRVVKIHRHFRQGRKNRRIPEGFSRFPLLRRFFRFGCGACARQARASLNRSLTLSINRGGGLVCAGRVSLTRPAVIVPAPAPSHFVSDNIPAPRVHVARAAVRSPARDRRGRFRSAAPPPWRFVFLLGARPA